MMVHDEYIMECYGYPDSLDPRLLVEARRAADLLEEADSVLVISHIDADGITAGTIAGETCRRLGKSFRVDFENKITEDTIETINSSEEDVVWICDLGSAYMSHFTRRAVIVTDHHVPDPEWRATGQTSLDGFTGSYQLNPHLWGVSGSYEVCGAGMTYILSKTVDPGNVDLAYLAVVGAIGDFQDDRECRLVSWNRLILDDAVGNGDVRVVNGIRWFGRGTRRLLRFLEYGDEPKVPGVSGDRDGCFDLLCGFGIEQRGADGRWLAWSDLPVSDRALLADTLVSRLEDPADAPRLFGEVYDIPRYAPSTGLGDAKEFATALNSCGRYGDAEIGRRMCLGDEDAVKEAERSRAEHRRNISGSISLVKSEHLLRKRPRLQYFDAGDRIPETVVGIVAGMMLSSGEASPDVPILAFADADDGTKASARASRELVDRGINLAEAMAEAASAVGGLGGGHNVAAGATIPPDRKEDFLDAAESIFVRQLAAGRRYVKGKASGEAKWFQSFIRV